MLSAGYTPWVRRKKTRMWALFIAESLPFKATTSGSRYSFRSTMSSKKTIVLITGANSGIGFDTAAALVQTTSDYHVIFTSRSLTKGHEAIATIEAQNPLGSLSYLQLDVTSPESIATAAGHITKEFGRLDVLISNAGIAEHGPDLLKELRTTFETNTFGAAVVTYAFVDLLKKSSNPRIIYVSSGLGSVAIRADPNDKNSAVTALAYRMSKAAVNMLAASNHKEFEEWRCKVWSLSPGFVVTNLGGGGAERREMLAKKGAVSSKTSAELILKVVEGQRDDDVGKFIHANGVHPW